MLVKTIWKNLLYGCFLGYTFTSPIRIMGCILLSILALPIDIILLPFELLALIIFFIISGNKED